MPSIPLQAGPVAICWAPESAYVDVPNLGVEAGRLVIRGPIFLEDTIYCEVSQDCDIELLGANLKATDTLTIVDAALTSACEWVADVDCSDGICDVATLGSPSTSWSPLPAAVGTSEKQTFSFGQPDIPYSLGAPEVYENVPFSDLAGLPLKTQDGVVKAGETHVAAFGTLTEGAVVLSITLTTGVEHDYKSVLQNEGLSANYKVAREIMF